MVLVAVISLCFLPYIISVKLVIDGTIDFGPSSKFENEVRPFRSFEPGPTIAIQLDGVTHDIDAKIDEENKEYVNGFDDGVKENSFVTHAVSDEDDNLREDVLREGLRITRFYEFKNSKIQNKEQVIYPRKIKEDEKIVNFIEHLKNKLLNIFETVRKETEDPETAQKIKELKEKFDSRYGKYYNETREHYIKTALGMKKVILNSVDYGHKLLDRLGNRLKLEMDNDLKRDLVAKTLKKETDRSVKAVYEAACRNFKICRTGNELSGFLVELFTMVSKGNDTKIEQVCKAVAKEMKKAKLNRIMDEETRSAFKDHMSLIEELGSFELRFILAGYNIMILSKNLPFSGNTPEDTDLQDIVAIFNVIETFDKNMEMTGSNKQWADRMKKEVTEFLSGQSENATDIGKEFVKQFQEVVINQLDDKTASELKKNFRKMLVYKTKPHYPVYVPYRLLFNLQ